MPCLVDSHCHLDDPRLDETRDEVLQRAMASGVCAMVVPGISAATWSRSRAVAEATPGIYWAAGLHPYFLKQHRPGDLDLLRTEIEKHRPVAIGECGLDYFGRDLDPAQQDFYFSEQLQIASDTGLPLVVHARKAVDQVTQTLRQAPDVRAQIHSYSGSAQQAYRLIDAGHMISIGATVLFDRARRLQRLVTEMPMEALLVETDAPDQPGPNHRGELNEPANVAEVVAKIAELRGISGDEVAAQTTLNAQRFFGISVASTGL